MSTRETQKWLPPPQTKPYLLKEELEDSHDPSFEQVITTSN